MDMACSCVAWQVDDADAIAAAIEHKEAGELPARAHARQQETYSTAPHSTAQRATTGTRRARWQASAPGCTCGRAMQQPACVCIEWRQQQSAALAATDLRTFAHAHAHAHARLIGLIA
jgi:hypothetical protein